MFQWNREHNDIDNILVKFEGNNFILTYVKLDSIFNILPKFNKYREEIDKVIKYFMLPPSRKKFPACKITDAIFYLTPPPAPLD